jgi:Cu/Ag efflux pump CusA
MLAVLASLVVALMVTPALTMALFARGGLKEAEPPLMRWSRERYRLLLESIAQRPRSIIATVAVLGLASLAALPFFGRSFIPELKEGHFIVHMSAVPGTGLRESLRLGGLVTQALHQLPAVRSVAQQVGRAEQADDTWGTHYSEFDVDLKPLAGKESEVVQSDIRDILARFPGVNFAVKPFLTERVEETLSGYTAAVVVNIFGNDLDLLDGKAREIAQIIGAVPGATDVQLQSPPGMPRLGVRLRQADLQRWGLDPLDTLDLVRTAYEGDTVGQIYEGNRTFGITVILDEKNRKSVTRVADLPLRTPSGTYVRLGQIADVYATSGRYQVLHRGAQRLQTVTANVAGRDVASFAAQARTRISAAVSLPAGSYLEFAGEAQAQSRSQRDLLFNSIIAAVGIVLLLSAVTRNTRNLLLVLANLPFALVGGVVAVFASGGLLSLGSMVGFLALFGITLRNSILMIAHYEQLVAVDGAEWGLSTAIRGAADRLTPILMTSIVTALGVLPLAIGMREPGREIEGPMAVVILGGLLTSMTLNLLVLPLLALRYGRFDAGKIDATTL